MAGLYLLNLSLGGGSKSRAGLYLPQADLSAETSGLLDLVLAVIMLTCPK